MIDIPVGPRPTPLGPSLVARARALPAAAIGDALGRDTCPEAIRPFSSVAQLGRMAGPALTVRTRVGDNLAVHVALDRARPGDVIVVDAGGATRNAIIGELMAAHALARGVHGIVIDGAVRDTDWISTGGLHVYARGATPAGPYKSGPGALHLPITLGGVCILDGDLVVGDSDGVVVIPRARLASAVSDAEGIVRREEERMHDNAAGRADRSWLATAVRLIDVDGPTSD